MGLNDLTDLQVRHTALMEASPDAIFFIDPSTQLFIEVNHAAEILTGYTREELRDLALDTLEPLETVSPEIGTSRWVVSGRQASADIISFRTKSGERVLVDLRMAVAETDRGSFLLAIARDVTERTRLVSELEQSLRELTALNRLFQEHLSQRFEVVDAYRETIEGLKKLSQETNSLVERTESLPLPDFYGIPGLGPADGESLQ